MRVFFVRHGESEANAGKVHTDPNTTLSELGVRQAKTVAKRLLEVNPDIIICSKLGRAVQTAKVIGGALGKRIVYTPLLNEWKLPSELYNVKPGSRKSEEIWGRIKKFSEDPDWRYSDEETTFEMVKRAEKALKYLSSRKEDKAVVVSHSGFICAAIHFAIFGSGADAGKLRRTLNLFHINNTGITEMEIERA